MSAMSPFFASPSLLLLLESRLWPELALEVEVEVEAERRASFKLVFSCPVELNTLEIAEAFVEIAIGGEWDEEVESLPWLCRHSPPDARNDVVLEREESLACLCMDASWWAA